MTRSLVSTVLALYFAICLPAFAKPDGFDAAVAVYNSHQYAKALSQFQKIGKASPNDASTHYYTALCYQALAQQNAAQQEYNWVYTHSNDQTLRYYSYQAMQKLGDWSKHRAYAGSGTAAATGSQPTAHAKFNNGLKVPDLSKPSSIMIGGENVPKGSEFCPFRNAH